MLQNKCADQLRRNHIICVKFFQNNQDIHVIVLTRFLAAERENCYHTFLLSQALLYCLEIFFKKSEIAT